MCVVRRRGLEPLCLELPAEICDYRVQLALAESEVLLGVQRDGYEQVKLLICVSGEFPNAPR